MRFAGLAGTAAALLAGAAAAGCSPATLQPPAASAGGVASLPSLSIPLQPPVLAAQPFRGAAGAGDRLVLRVHGTGPQVLPRFTVTGASLYFEIACLGPGSFTVMQRQPLFLVGPCDGSGTTSTVGGERGRTLRLSVDVPVTTRWELYLTEG